MRDELRRLDHLTPNQRALITEDTTGELTFEDEGLRSSTSKSRAIQSRILSYATRFLRADADLAERQRFVVVKREPEGCSNIEIADALDVPEGRVPRVALLSCEAPHSIRSREQIGDSFVDAA